jgi:hypothetical protein
MQKHHSIAQKLLAACKVSLLWTLTGNDAFAQFPVKTELAYKKVLLRIEVTKPADDAFLVKLSAVASDTLQLKTEATQYLSEWDPQVITATLQSLLGELSADSSYERSRYYPVLDSLLGKAFPKLEAKRFAASVESLAQLNYGLTEVDINNLDRYKLALQRVQDTIRYLRALDAAHRNQLNHQQKPEKGVDATITVGEVIKKLAFTGNQNKSAVFPSSYTIDTLKVVKHVLKKEINRINGRRKFLVSLIGNANVVSSFKSIERSEINAGFGVIANKPGFAEFVGVLTVAQANDEVNSTNKFDFGQCLLVPGIRKFSLLTHYRTYSIFRNSPSQFAKKVGMGFDFNATPYRWISNTDTAKVIPFAFNVIVPYTWILQAEPGKDFAISTEIGLTTRYIGGDATKEQLSAFLGSDKRFYIGAIAGLNIKYNALRAQFHAPFLFGKERVPGLTHGQVYASIGIVGSLINDITGVLKKKKED